MYIDDKGIVLRCIKYDDKSFIAHLFTASHGHVAFMVNGSRNKRSGGTARLFQPLSFLSFQWDAKPSTTLHRMKEVRLLFVQHNIPFDPIKRSVAMLLAEFIDYALREEAKNIELYTYFENSFRWFDLANTGFTNFHLVFLVKMAKFIGIAPNIDAYEEGFLFDLTRGSFVEHGISATTMMDSRDAALLYQLHLANYESMESIAMNRQDRARLIDFLATYYAIHLPKFPALQSLQILQEVMSA